MNPPPLLPGVDHDNTNDEGCRWLADSAVGGPGGRGSVKRGSVVNALMGPQRPARFTACTANMYPAPAVRPDKTNEVAGCTKKPKMTQIPIIEYQQQHS